MRLPPMVVCLVWCAMLTAPLSADPWSPDTTMNATELLVDSGQVVPRAIAMIDRAERTVHFDMYLWGGTIGTRVVEAMDRARNRGGGVRVLTAAASVVTLAMRQVQRLAVAIRPDGGTRVFTPVADDARRLGLAVADYPTGKLPGLAFVKANHNKVLIVDGREALVGGMNFADVVAENHDCMIWLQGPAVAELDGIFADNWSLCRRTEPCTVAPPTAMTVPVDGSNGTEHHRAAVVVAYSNVFLQVTRRVVADAIEHAERSIRLMMFTFTDDAMVERVIRAHRRGVDVKILLDPNVHAFGMQLMGLPNLATVRQLKAAGIDVRAFRTLPGMQMHVKALAIDDRILCTGSTNFTRAGFDVNNETFLRLESPELTARFMALFDEDWQRRSYVLQSDGPVRVVLSTVSEALDGGF